MWPAGVAVCIALFPLAAVAQAALKDYGMPPVIQSAALISPTDRYDHGILGDAVEWGALRLTLNLCPSCDSIKEATVDHVLPKNRVFEDITTRIADLDGDGLPEVIVVETDLTRGASLAVYDIDGRRAATPFIGQTHRWLAPAGTGDFDGDGLIEIAYVDRPHLTKELVFLWLDSNRLRELARVPGLTNHQIGNNFISGGMRNCGQGDEVVLVSADWSRLMAVRMGTPATDLGRYSKAAMKRALDCR